MGDRARGLQRGRRRLGLLHPRPGAVARLPLGRGRPGRHLRRQAAALLRAGAVERQGPDPQGAPVRADQQPRATTARTSRSTTSTSTRTPTHSYMKYLYKYPQAAYPVRRPGRDQPQARPERVRVRAARHRRLRRGSLLRRLRRVRQGLARGHPDPDHGPQPRAGRRRRSHLLPTLWFRNAWSWHADATRPTLAQVADRPGRASSRPSTRGWATRYLYCEGDVPLLFTENETNTQRLFGVPNRSRPTSRTASTTTSSTARTTR